MANSIGRRAFLHGTALAGVVGLAGCSDGGDTTDSTDDSDSNSAGSEGDDSLEIRVGTSTGGTRDVGLAVERAVSEASDVLTYSTIESPGYIGTIRRMDQGQFNAGITDNNSLNKAFNDEDDFADNPVSNLPYYGFAAFPYSIYIVARDGTGIETFADLAGASVYPAQPGFSTRATTLDVFSQDSVSEVYDQMNLLNLNVDDAPGAMEEGTIDASIAYGTPGVRYTGFVQEIASRVDIHYVEPTNALVAAAESYPGAGTTRTAYSDWQIADQDIGTDEVFTWDLEVLYVFTSEADTDAVYELSRVVDEANDVVNEGEAQFNDYESTEDLLAYAQEQIPVHPGVAQYCQDNDAWDESLQIGE